MSPRPPICDPGAIQGASESEARALRAVVEPRPARAAPGGPILGRRPSRDPRRALGDGVALGALREAPGAQGEALAQGAEAAPQEARREAQGAQGAEVEALGASQDVAKGLIGCRKGVDRMSQRGR